MTEKLFCTCVGLNPVVHDEPIRIMHIVDVLSLSGMEYGVIKLVNQLDRGRISPMICCLRFQREATKSLLESRVSVFELHKRPGRDFSVILKLSNLFRRERIFMVHSHNWQTFFYTAVAAMLSRIPIFIHGEHGRESESVPRRQLFLKRYLSTLVTQLVTVNDDLRREIVSNWNVRLEKVTAVYNGVDLDRFAESKNLDKMRQEFHLTPDNRVVLTVGGIRKVKDHPTLLKGFARLYQRVPEARLMIVGSDWGTGFQSDLEKLAESLGIEKVVYFLGIRHDIPQLLSLCQVYVNTSIYEGMSNTILEAMAAQKPVVATAVGGTPELVMDNVTGYLIASGDDRQLGDRLEKVLNNSDVSQEMGIAGRSRVEHDHPMSRMVNGYSSLYRELSCRYQLKKTCTTREKIKRYIAGSLHFSGLNSLKKLAESDQLIILTYHRVLPLYESLAYPFQPMVMPRDLFDAQMAYLSQHYTVCELPEAIRLLKNGKLQRRTVAVTFDDGYMDNYEHALPILKRYEIPATFFLTTGAIDGTVSLWWDEVHEYLKRLSDTRKKISGDHELPDWMVSNIERLHHGTDLVTVTRDLVHRLNNLSLGERKRSLEFLKALAGKSSDHETGIMLSWENVHELCRSGMNVGAHTITHAFLDELDEGTACQEIEGSISRLREKTGSDVHVFSYPRGRVSKQVKKLLQNAGIEGAVTTELGKNRRDADLLHLKRLDSGYCNFPGGFVPAMFEAELQGWFHLFRGI